MYKIVIFSDNFDVVKKTCNTLLSKFNNLHLLGVSSTYDELLELTTNSKINMLILSETDMKCAKVEQFVKKIENKIVLCQDATKHKNLKYVLYLPLETDPEHSINLFKKFISKVNNKIIHKKVFDILEKLNFDFKLIGTNYLLDAIIYSYMNKNDYRFENLEKNIYPHVAKLYHASDSNIKWSIIRSVNNMNAHQDPSNLDNPYINFCEKVTPKLLINEIVNKI